MKNRILLALLLLSGSLHAQGETDEPGFIKIVQRANPLYLSVQGIASVSGKPNTITYPLVTNITTDQPGYPSIKGQSIVMTVEIDCLCKLPYLFVLFLISAMIASDLPCRRQI